MSAEIPKPELPELSFRRFEDLSEHHWWPDSKKALCKHIVENGLDIRTFCSDHSLKAPTIYPGCRNIMFCRRREETIFMGLLVDPSW